MEAKPAQLPGWISELRNAWNQEIDHLPDERRRFFISQQTDYLRRSSLASPPPGGSHARAGGLLPQDILSSPPSQQSSLGGSFASSLESSRSVSPRHSPTLSSRSLSPPALTPSSAPSASSFAMPTASPHPLQIQRMSSDRRASASASNLTASLAAVASETQSAAAASASASSVAAPATNQFARRHSEMPLASAARAAEDARRAAEASKASAAAAAALSSSPPLFSRLYGALFGSSNSAEAKRAEITRYSEKLKFGITQHEQRLMKLLKDRKMIAKRMSTECEQFQRWGLDALVSAARTLYETQLLRAGAQLELEGHQGALLSSQINAAQHAIEKGEAAALPPGQGALLRDRDGKLMEVDRLIAPLSGYLPSDAPSVHQSVRALTSIIEHLQTAYDECQRRDLRVETIEQRSKRYESCLAKCFGAREVDAADAQAAAAVVVSDSSSSSPTSQSSPSSPSPSSLSPSAAAAGTTIGGMYFHPLGAEQQHVFSQMLIDQRQSEGQKLARWEAWFAAAEPEKRSAEAVAAFWNFLVSTIQSKYKRAYCAHCLSISSR